jgi:hypothetical protein
MIRTNYDLLSDISIFSEETKDDFIVISRNLINLLYADESPEFRKKISVVCRKKECFLKELKTTDSISHYICNPEEISEKISVSRIIARKAHVISEKIFSMRSVSEITGNRNELRSDDMTIIGSIDDMTVIGTIFVFICLAIAWIVFIRQQNTTCREAVDYLTDAIERNPENRIWCEKVLNTIGKKKWGSGKNEWSWEFGLQNSKLLEAEQKMAIGYFDSCTPPFDYRWIAPSKGDSFDSKTMETSGEHLPYVYQLLCRGIIVNKTPVLKGWVLCATKDFLTMEKIGDQSLTEYCRSENHESFEKRNIEFTEDYCHAMHFFFKEELSKLLEQFCQYDERYRKTAYSVGDKYYDDSMDSEEISIPEHAVVTKIIRQGLYRNNELIIKPLVSVKEE